MIVKTDCETNGALHSTSRYDCVASESEGWWRDVKISIPKLLRLFVVNAAVPECDAVSTVQSIQTLHHYNMAFYCLISLQNMQNMFNHWQYMYISSSIVILQHKECNQFMEIVMVVLVCGARGNWG